MFSLVSAADSSATSTSVIRLSAARKFSEEVPRTRLATSKRLSAEPI
jgi:hypothetical protein